MTTTRFTASLIKAPGIGAVGRTTPGRLTDIINVREFGADPTGQQDSADAFEAAIWAARSQTLIDAYVGLGAADHDIKSIGIVYIPRGDYFVSRSVEIIPGATSAGARGTSYTIRGESAGSTKIFGNFNGFILTSGFDAGMTGGFIIENLTVHNGNTTAYSSGAVYNGGCNSVTRNCVLYGMVGLASQSLTCFQGASYNNVFLGPGLGINSIGFSQTTDGSVCSCCYFTNWDVAHVVGQDAAAVLGNVYERNRLALDLGGIYNLGFQYNGASGFGAGHVTPVSVLGNKFKSNGTSIRGKSFSGIVASFHIDCTPAAGISDSDNVQYGVDINSCTGTIMNGFVTGGPIDEFAYKVDDLSGGNGSLTAIGLQTDVPYAKRWSLPGSAGGGAVVLSGARVINFIGCDIGLVWKFADLPWGLLTDASITDTTLAFSGYGARFGLFLYQFGTRWLLGTGVTPGTRAISTGTTFPFGIIDSGDGTGAAGNVLTFLGTPIGPAPVEGVSIFIDGSIGTYTGNGTVDNGSGTGVTSGDIFTDTNYVTLTGATISDGSGGAGDILDFSSHNNNVYYNQNVLFSRLAIGIGGAGGIPRDTFIIERISGTQCRINRDLHIGTPTTMYILPDYRPGYKFQSASPNDSLQRPPPTGAALVTELSLTQWELDTSIAYGPIGPMVITNPSYPGPTLRTLGSQINANQWNVSGAALNIGISSQIILPDTWLVDKSQTTGAPSTFTFFLDAPGATYEISDSPTPAWTGSVSNIGQAVTVGGGSHRVKVRLDEAYGYVIAG